MAYVYSVNNTPADGGVAMFQLKELLKTAGWTVTSSGNGSGGNFSSSGDVWLTSSDADNPDAWLAIQKPGSTEQFLFQMYPGAFPQWWSVFFSRTPFTGGSATVAATSANQVQFTDRLTNAFFPAAASHRWHIVADNAAPYGFWAAAYPIGGGNVTSVIVYDPMLAGTFGVTDSDPYTIIGANAVSRPFYWPYLMYPAYNFNRAYLGAATSLANFVSVGYAPCFSYSFTGSYVPIFPAGGSTNPFTGAEDLLQLPVVRHNSWPAPIGYKGLSTMLRVNGTTRATGDKIDVGADSWIVMENVVLPWPQAETPVV